MWVMLVILGLIFLLMIPSVFSYFRRNEEMVSGGSWGDQIFRRANRKKPGDPSE
jgi:hypothetical protein